MTDGPSFLYSLSKFSLGPYRFPWFGATADLFTLVYRYSSCYVFLEVCYLLYSGYLFSQDKTGRFVALIISRAYILYVITGLYFHYRVVKEELIDDNAKLPCFNGRVVSWVNI